MYIPSSFLGADIPVNRQKARLGRAFFLEFIMVEDAAKPQTVSRCLQQFAEAPLLRRDPSFRCGDTKAAYCALR